VEAELTRALRALGLASVALVACAAVARAETRPPYAGTIEATLLGSPATLDPVLARSHAEITAVGLLFDTLYTLGPDGDAQPHLAVAAPVLDERRTTARITIRKGVRFHDGSELVPQDVAASLERARAHARWQLAGIAEIHADADAIELSLRAPVPDLTTWLALPQTAVTKGGRPPGERPIGTGAYVLETFDRATHRMQLRPFDDHFAGRPYAELVLRWYDTVDGEAGKFESGAAQLSSRGVVVFAKSVPTFRPADHPVESPVPVLVFVGFGAAHPAVTGDRAFRRAVDLAIARGGLAMITSGETVAPTTQPVPSAPALDAATSAGDLTAAMTQLAEAVRRVPALQPEKRTALKLEILVEDTRPDDREIADRVARALDRLGLATTISARPAQDIRERVAKGQCDLWIGQLVQPGKLEAAWWSAAFAAGNDDWPATQLAAGALDPVAAAKAFEDRQPIVPLMFRGYKLWYRSDVHGLDFDGLGRPTLADLFYFGSPVRAKR
jgi:MarR-like DNA-binding transcriptional regulator SgrR of sgrS sRNA